MTDLLIHHVRALEPGKGVIASWLRISGGKIASMGKDDKLPNDVATTIDGSGCLLTPGMIDIHTHGIEHFAYETSPEQLIEASRLPPRYGTTCVLPTLYRSMSRPRLGELEKLSAALSASEATCMPGLHLEGPFMAVTGAGAQTIPGDLGLLEELISATCGKIIAMSLSPEVPGILRVIELLCEKGIIPLITHTQATVAETEAAIEAGARHATHFYDVFPIPTETEPGVRPAGAVETILADRRTSVDFIADGVHVHPTAIKAALAAKGWQQVILITDSNVGAGLLPGDYDSPVGGKVRIAPGDAARICQPGSPLNGLLAGSVLTMNVGMKNLLKWLPLPEEQAWAMSTRNPANLLGLVSKGTLCPGADADLVLWRQFPDRLLPLKTWINGQLVFESNEQ